MSRAQSIMGMSTLAWRGMRRRPTRSALVLAGVAVAVFLFCTVDAMRSGVERATQQSSRVSRWPHRGFLQWRSRTTAAIGW